MVISCFADQSHSIKLISFSHTVFKLILVSFSSFKNSHHSCTNAIYSCCFKFLLSLTLCFNIIITILDSYHFFYFEHLVAILNAFRTSVLDFFRFINLNILDLIVACKHEFTLWIAIVTLNNFC